MKCRSFSKGFTCFHDHGEVRLDDVVCIAADRAAGKTYKQVLVVNNTPTLTTTNRYLMVLDVRSVVKNVPDADREFFRLLEVVERLGLQGFPKKLTKYMATDVLGIKAAGNAYPIPLIVACSAPMLVALSDRCLAKLPKSIPYIPEEMFKFCAAIRRKGKIVQKWKVNSKKKAPKKRAIKRRFPESDSE